MIHNYTPRQIEVITEFDAARELMVSLLALAKKARGAVVKLPAIGANGEPVTHKCNVTVYNAGMAYYSAAIALKSIVGDETNTIFQNFGFSTGNYNT